MKFPSWREPKPIRVSHPTSPRDHLQSNQKNFPIIRRSLDAKGESEVKDIVNRLSTPTLSAKMKNVTYKPNVVMMNMNYYSWANMAAYKDHQRTLYTRNGTMKRACRKSAKRWHGIYSLYFVRVSGEQLCDDAVGGSVECPLNALNVENMTLKGNETLFLLYKPSLCILIIFSTHTAKSAKMNRTRN